MIEPAVARAVDPVLRKVEETLGSGGGRDGGPKTPSTIGFTRRCRKLWGGLERIAIGDCFPLEAVYGAYLFFIWSSPGLAPSKLKVTGGPKWGFEGL